MSKIDNALYKALELPKGSLKLKFSTSHSTINFTDSDLKRALTVLEGKVSNFQTQADVIAAADNLNRNSHLKIYSYSTFESPGDSERRVSHIRLKAKQNSM